MSEFRGFFVGCAALLAFGCSSTDDEGGSGLADTGSTSSVDVISTDVAVADTADDVADVSLDSGTDVSDDVSDIVEFDVLDNGPEVIEPDIIEDIQVEDVPDVPEDDVGLDVPPIDDMVDPPDVAPDVADVAPDAGDDDGSTLECQTHKQCDDADPCTKDVCVEGACVITTVSCDDGDSCTTDQCVAGVGCSSEFQGGPGCVPSTELFAATFDDCSLDGMIVSDVALNVDEGQLPIVWTPDPTQVFAGAGALYFGQTDTYDYDNGKVVASSARTPAITLPANKASYFSFQLWMDVEPGAWWDVLTVTVTPEGENAIPVWAKSDANVVMNQWLPISIDLGSFSGKVVEIEVVFHSIENSFNSTTGVFIDSLEVSSLAVAKTCTTNAQCSDGIGCTEDVCVEGTCEYTFGDACCITAADCQDGDECTIELCQVGQCVFFDVPDPTCCNTTSDCDDNNDCTDDLCAPNNRCENTVSSAEGCCTKTSECNDSDTCTKDACVDFTCQNVNTCCLSDAECNDGDDVCTIDTCVAGACKFKYKPIAGCCTPVLFEDDFEAGGDGWSATGDGGACQWQVWGGGQSKSPSNSIWYGNPAVGHYDCNDSNHSGTTTSEPIDVPDKDGLSLEFDVWFDVESGSSYDLIEVYIVVNGAQSQLFNKGQLGPESVWNKRTASLNAYKGQTVQIRLRFDTVDSVFNDSAGAFFDDIKITDPCE